MKPDMWIYCGAVHGEIGKAYCEQFAFTGVKLLGVKTGLTTRD